MIELDLKMTVSELMRSYPAAIGIFIRNKMPCIGCPAEAFHTIDDAARMNGIPLKYLLEDLRHIIGTGQNP